MRAAAQTFQRLGYAKAAVADVLKTAGMSRRSFYEFFTSKEDVLLAIIEVAGHFIESMDQGADDTEDPLTRIDRAFDAYVTLGGADFPRIGYQVMAAGEVPRARRMHYFHRLTDLFERELLRAHDAGLLPRKPDRTTVELILRALDATVLEYHMEGRADQLKEILPAAKALYRNAFR